MCPRFIPDKTKEVGKLDALIRKGYYVLVETQDDMIHIVESSVDKEMVEDTLEHGYSDDERAKYKPYIVAPDNGVWGDERS